MLTYNCCCYTTAAEALGYSLDLPSLSGCQWCPALTPAILQVPPDLPLPQGPCGGS
jgi:hypothetical protein